MPPRVPPELRTRSWTEGTVWELLTAAELLPYRFTSPLADLGITLREWRRRRREEERLKTTRVRFVLPRPATARRPPQPWLYVHARRGGYYRVSNEGEIERYSRHTQHFGATTVTEHRWHRCTLRGLRWLYVIADERLVRKLRADYP